MPDGRSVLEADSIVEAAEDSPAGETVVETSGPPTLGRDEALRVLRAPVGEMLGILPNALAIRYADKRMRLSPEELERGTTVWVGALDVLFPDLDRLLKVLVVLGVVTWTVATALSRFAMIAENKRARRAKPADAESVRRGPLGPGPAPEGPEGEGPEGEAPEAEVERAMQE